MDGSVLSYRSELLRAIRDYFYAEELLEVFTDTLRPFGTNEVHLSNLMAGDLYLQTSPEHAMKHLLAEYQQSIFQICPAFREGEVGTKHRTEFLMLEWYRCGYSLESLQDDLLALLRFVAGRVENDLDLGTFRVVSYRSLFEAEFGRNPHTIEDAELAQLAGSLDYLGDSASRADWFDGLFASVIEPSLAEPTVVYDYPACQMALAEVAENAEGDLVSRRFELYLSGMEIANAYQELTDAAELQTRFQHNRTVRKQLGKVDVPDDEELLSAMQKLPDCSGIALGIDRLMMALRGEHQIDAVRP